MNGFDYEGWWIAGTNLHEDPTSNQSYVWFTTGDPFKYTYWDSYQPDNHEKKEHCVQVVQHNLKWNDIDCEVKMFFICQKRDY